MSDQVFKKLWRGPGKDSLTLVLRKGYLASDPDLCERFIDKMDELVGKGLADKGVYAGLRAFYLQNEKAFKACFTQNRDDRALLRARKMKAILPPSFKPKKILDVGCGDGAITSYLGKIFNLTARDVYGIDLYARHEEEENFTFLSHAQEGKIPVKDRKFDLILALMVMHHTPDAPALLKEMRRTLNDDGIILIRETDAGYPGGAAFNTVNDEMFFRVFQDNHNLAQDLNFKDEKSWKEIFNRAGFAVVGTNHSEADRVFNPVWYLLKKRAP